MRKQSCKARRLDSGYRADTKPPRRLVGRRDRRLYQASIREGEARSAAAVGRPCRAAGAAMTSDDADRFLEEGRRRYDNGETDELPYCLQFCIGNRLPIPDWLATAFMTAYEKIISFEAASWDDVFGKHLRKGGRLARERQRWVLARPIFETVQERHAAGRSINKELFYEIGREFGVSGTVASEIYYLAKSDKASTIEQIIARKWTSDKD